MSTDSVFTTWVKSTRSGGNDNCVEVAFAANGTVGVRHSRKPGGPVLEFTPSEWAAFVEGVASGELRGPAGGSGNPQGTGTAAL
jgi:hypothetical protein